VNTSCGCRTAGVMKGQSNSTARMVASKRMDAAKAFPRNHLDCLFAPLSLSIIDCASTFGLLTDTPLRFVGTCSENFTTSGRRFSRSLSLAFTGPREPPNPLPGHRHHRRPLVPGTVNNSSKMVCGFLWSLASERGRRASKKQYIAPMGRRQTS
jgi:hypothetical protein